MDWRRVSGVHVLLWLLTEPWRFFCRRQVELSPNFLEYGSWCFWMSARHLPSWASGNDRFSQLVMKLEACLRQIFEQFKLLKFPVTCGHCCAEWLWQLRNSIDVVCWNLLSCLCSATVEGPLKSGLLQLTQGCCPFHCGVVVKLWGAPAFFRFSEEIAGEQYRISTWTLVTS